jgi:hypothetical protein
MLPHLDSSFLSLHCYKKRDELDDELAKHSLVAGDNLSIHPPGESQKVADGSAKSRQLDTPRGLFYAKWDTEIPVTREGQLIIKHRLPSLTLCDDTVALPGAINI